MTETKEKDLILENLNYIGLDIKNIPEFLLNCEDVDYKPATVIEQREIKVYKYINIKDIQILFTSASRQSSISEKYSKAIHLSEYLKSENNNVFLEMLEKIDKKEILKIEEEQSLAKRNVPFRVKLETSYFWEIYYSQFTGKYFMMVSLESVNYNILFYLLKKQIECYKLNKEETIYVPIVHLDYSKRYLNGNEILEIEKYIWMFTKQCAKVYEVFDNENESTMHIVGNTTVYDKIKSYYKIELKDKNEAIKFYEFIKALFILKAQLPQYYDFDTQINEKGELTFELNNKVINSGNLLKFIKEEYKKHSRELEKIFIEKEKVDIELEKLKEEELEKSKEFVFKEKQISMYLSCRKSVLGKIKYFLNKNGKFYKGKDKNSRTNKAKELNDLEKSITNSVIEEKEDYNIDDLIKICIEVNRINFKIKNAKLDIKEVQEKIKIVTAKIKNATLFIDTIEEHKKSIFEFWKFSNKDLPLGLNYGAKEEIEEEQKEKEIIKKEEGINIYLCSTDKINLIGNQIFYLDSTNAINSINEEKVSLSKVKVLTPLNIQDDQETIEINMDNFRVDLKKQKIFRISCEGEKFNFREKIICVYEYEAK